MKSNGIKRPGLMLSIMVTAWICLTASSQFAMGAAFQYLSPIESHGDGEAAEQTEPIATLGTDDDVFEMVRSAPGVVLVDFYADWCGPCKTQSGYLHGVRQLATDNNARIIKINVDEHPELARRFQITNLPTLMLVKEGLIVERHMGIADRTELADFLRR